MYLRGCEGPAEPYRMESATLLNCAVLPRDKSASASSWPIGLAIAASDWLLSEDACPGGRYMLARVRDLGRLWVSSRVPSSPLIETYCELRLTRTEGMRFVTEGQKGKDWGKGGAQSGHKSMAMIYSELRPNIATSLVTSTLSRNPIYEL